MNSQSGKDKGHKHSGNQHSNSIPPNSPDDEPRREPPTKNRKQPRDQAYWEKRQYRVQRLIAYAGVFGIIIYGLQLWEMRKSTDAATKAAKAAEESVRFANKSARFDERAWVTASVAQEIPQIGKVFTVTVTAKNNGKTFARGFKLYSVIARLDPDQIPDFSVGRKMADEAISQGSVSILPPVGEYSASTEINLSFKTSEIPALVTEESLKEFVAGKYRVMNYGWLTYYDIFGCDHWTIFANELMPGGTEGAFKWRTYSTHNDADVNTCTD